ncbi:ATP-binding cassette domain-containing protein [Betaproteobacteria bacterium PRO7]|jgi:ATP-binding cassette subfamily F protein uup|nr:ATP-binding cassette domain-containing protein [Betaproteobacteria bacterium PRO7]
MTMLSLLDAQLAFGDLPLLDRAQLAVGDGDRIGLIGRNGSGKSSLLNVIAGRLPLDGGEIKRRDGLRVVLVEQEPELPAAHTLRESLLVRGGIEAMPDERERWRTEARLAEYLHRFGLDGHTNPAAASGGERKRGALALALALQPELLLLDEPTNHLDIDAIAQLESLLAEKGAPTSIVITHDRAFLDRVATRIVELDRGALRAYPGNYSDFERRRESELEAEDKAARRFDRFWAQEEAWIRKGIEARRTRNAGRVARLEQLRRERAARRERSGRIKLALDAGERSGKLVAELENVTKRFGERVVVRGFSCVIRRGDRIGLIGPNGAGKSTLLKLIVGALEPDSGTVRHGTNLQVAYFDQMREALDPDKTVAETIAPGSDWVEIAGVRKHVIGYLGDFLFPPRRAAAPVGTLSGGERNRLLLARLFAQPANLLVLDEPTNDLDIESLELLEQTLQEYEGTLLLVSHDRAFLDNVVTQTIAAEGGGVWKEYVGGYSDWLAQRPQQIPSPRERGEGEGRPTKAESPSPQPSPGKRGEGAKPKLGFKEQRELEALPGEIEALEREQSELTAAMSSADYHKRGADAIRADRARAAAIERLLADKFDRWAALEEKAKAAG